MTRKLWPLRAFLQNHFPVERKPFPAAAKNGFSLKVSCFKGDGRLPMTRRWYRKKVLSFCSQKLG